MSEARYAVGIDLGTTHCVMAAVDLTAEDVDGAMQWSVSVPQLTAPGAVEERPMLPSFLYLPHPDELKPDDRTLPWGEPQPFVVGELARIMGSRTPIRLVASAKSWLCHPGVDRRAAILPVEAPDEVQRVSPLDASIRYL
ncbi:MAG: Hsp70 family protein, partial [Candidatus Competibacter sp.]